MSIKRKLFLPFIALLFLMTLPVLAAVERSDQSGLSEKLVLPVYEWRDPSIRQKASIVAVHGLTFYAGAFDDLATHLAEKGYTVYAADLRGFGRWKEESNKFGGDGKIHYTQSQDDLLNVLKAVRQENPQDKVFCLGESFGANYAVWVASTNAQLVDGAILCSPCVKMYVHPRLRWSVDFVKGVFNPQGELNLEPYINPYLSHDRALTQACLQDPKICRSLSPVDLVKTDITNKRTLTRIRDIPAEMPILIIAGEKDRVFKARALPKFVPELGSKHVMIRVLKDKGHLLFEHQPVQPEIADLVDHWLQEQTESPEKIVGVPAKLAPNQCPKYCVGD